jgi:hypothetical protein
LAIESGSLPDLPFSTSLRAALERMVVAVPPKPSSDNLSARSSEGKGFDVASACVRHTEGRNLIAAVEDTERKANRDQARARKMAEGQAADAEARSLRLASEPALTTLSTQPHPNNCFASQEKTLATT